MAQVFQCDVSGKIGDRGGVIVYDTDPNDPESEQTRVEVCTEVWDKLMAILKPAARRRRGGGVTEPAAADA